MTLANIDPRILAALRAIRNGDLCYTKGSCTPPDLLTSFAGDLGYPREWGDVSRLPAYGGSRANVAWNVIGLSNRRGLGGIPCELVHGGVTGGSCTANVLIRGAQAFAQAILIYLPVCPSIYINTGILTFKCPIGTFPSNPIDTTSSTLTAFTSYQHHPIRMPKRILPVCIRVIHLGSGLFDPDIAPCPSLSMHLT